MTNNPSRVHTPCCALCQLRAGNDTPKEAIAAMLDEIREESKEQWLGEPNIGGERAAYCIVSPNEEELEQNLLQLGFEHLTTFTRRNGYPTGLNKMYFINLFLSDTEELLK